MREAEAFRPLGLYVPSLLTLCITCNSARIQSRLRLIGRYVSTRRQERIWKQTPADFGETNDGRPISSARRTCGSDRAGRTSTFRSTPRKAQGAEAPPPPPPKRLLEHEQQSSANPLRRWTLILLAICALLFVYH